MTYLPESSYFELLLWLLRRRRRFRVTGLSMMPLLTPQTEVLVDFRAYRHQFPLPDEIVVARHPYKDLPIIKRVIWVEEDGSCFLQGDNLAESNDSRSFGLVGLDNIYGKVTSRLP